MFPKRSKTRLLILPAAASAALLMAGCGNGSDDNTPAAESSPAQSQSSAPAERSTVAAEPVGPADQPYLQVLQRLEVKFPSDEVAVQVGKQVCADLRSGDDFLTSTERIGYGLQMVDKGKVTGSAVPVYCKDQMDKLR